MTRRRMAWEENMIPVSRAAWVVRQLLRTGRIPDPERRRRSEAFAAELEARARAAERRTP